MNACDRTRAVVLAALVSGATTLVAPRAAAEPTRMDLIVVEIATDDADDAAKALTLALRDEIRAANDLHLVDVDASLQVMMLSLKCVGDVPDTSCQTKIADKLKADRYVWGTARKGKGNEVLADLHLWQRGKSEVRYQTSFDERTAAAARGPISNIARESIDKLARGAVQGTARLLAPETTNGTIFVDGVESGQMKSGVGEVRSMPGPHWFEVKANGKVIAQGKGELRANTAQVITLTTSLVTPASSNSPTPPSTAGTTDTPPSHKGWHRPVGWGAIAAGGVMIAGGFVSMAKVSSIDSQSDLDAYRRGFGSKQDICDMARSGRTSTIPGSASPGQVSSYCSSATTFEVLEFVLLGLGVVSAGAGTYLLVTHPSSSTSTSSTPPPSRVRVTPRTGEVRGMNVELSF